MAVKMERGEGGRERANTTTVCCTDDTLGQVAQNYLLGKMRNLANFHGPDTFPVI